MVPLVNKAIRAAVWVHHKIRKPQTRPCPHAVAGGCSRYFATQAQTAGFAALPAILGAMAVCGSPGVTVGDGVCDCGGPCLFSDRFR